MKHERGGGYISQYLESLDKGIKVGNREADMVSTREGLRIANKRLRPRSGEGITLDEMKGEGRGEREPDDLESTKIGGLDPLEP